MTASVWQRIGDTLLAEFSDLPDAEQITRMLRLTLAALLGGPLGMEREQKGKAAGVRTSLDAAGKNAPQKRSGAAWSVQAVTGGLNKRTSQETWRCFAMRSSCLKP